MRTLLSIFLVAMSGSLAIASSTPKLTQHHATFDGQRFRCSQKTDLNRTLARVITSNSRLKNGHLEFNLVVETAVCAQAKSPPHEFEFIPTSLKGRFTNSKNGFIEFKTLELVLITPDLKVIRSTPIDIHRNRFNFQFSVPASDVPGLLARNIIESGDRSAVFLATIRGNASLGDAITGKVKTNTAVSFGAQQIKFSEIDGSLAVAPTLDSLLAASSTGISEKLESRQKPKL